MKLHNPQIFELLKLAQRAFERAQETARQTPGGLYVDVLLNDFEEWRHEEVGKACGKAGLSLCSVDDYNAVKAHFLRLLGFERAAQHCDTRGHTDAHRTAEHVLLRNMAERGISHAYVEKICRNKFKCTVSEANTKQLWSLIYTVRNRKSPATRAKEAKV